MLQHATESPRDCKTLHKSTRRGKLCHLSGDPRARYGLQLANPARRQRGAERGPSSRAALGVLEAGILRAAFGKDGQPLRAAS